MRIWIDATRMDERIRVFGMTLLERLLLGICDTERSLAGLDAAASKLSDLVQAKARLQGFLGSNMHPTEVRIELAKGAIPPRKIPHQLFGRLPIRWLESDLPASERLEAAVRDAGGEPVLALSAEHIVDGRILEHLVWSDGNRAFVAGDGGERAAVLRLASLPAGGLEGGSLLEIAEAGIEKGDLEPISPSELPVYIARLRRSLPPFLFRVADDQAVARVERFLFLSNYKGSTDFLTKYVYPPLVWRIVRPLAEHRVSPTLVTGLAIVCTVLAVPCFASGAWGAGVLLGLVMTVLDSVDGKLARLTFSTSAQGTILDHGTDLIHPPIWYFAWAWGLSGGDPFSSVFQASIWMFGLYTLDRLLERLFKACTGGRQIQDMTPLDVKLRTFASRRNPNLAIFVLGLALGLGTAAFYAIVALQALTATYHLVRVVQYWNAADAQRPLEQDPLIA